MEFREPSARVDQLAFKVIGAAIEVHRHLGPGLLEAAYQHSLAHELRLQGLEVRQQVLVPINYKGLNVASYELDLLVEEELVVELKSVERFSELHRAQVICYLQATHLELGLLINFNVPRLKEGVRRVIRGSTSVLVERG